MDTDTDTDKSRRVWLSNWHAGQVEEFFPNRKLTPIPETYSFETTVADDQDLIKLIQECPRNKAIVQFFQDHEYDVAIYFTQSNSFGQR